jgi:hypothetical protein
MATDFTYRPGKDWMQEKKQTCSKCGRLCFRLFYKEQYVKGEPDPGLCISCAG